MDPGLVQPLQAYMLPHLQPQHLAAIRGNSHTGQQLVDGAPFELLEGSLCSLLPPLMRTHATGRKSRQCLLRAFARTFGQVRAANATLLLLPGLAPEASSSSRSPRISFLSWVPLWPQSYLMAEYVRHLQPQLQPNEPGSFQSLKVIPTNTSPPLCKDFGPVPNL